MYCILPGCYGINSQPSDKITVRIINIFIHTQSALHLDVEEK